MARCRGARVGCVATTTAVAVAAAAAAAVLGVLASMAAGERAGAAAGAAPSTAPPHPYAGGGKHAPSPPLPPPPRGGAPARAFPVGTTVPRFPPQPSVAPPAASATPTGTPRASPAVGGGALPAVTGAPLVGVVPPAGGTSAGAGGGIPPAPPRRAPFKTPCSSAAPSPGASARTAAPTRPPPPPAATGDLGGPCREDLSRQPCRRGLVCDDTGCVRRLEPGGHCGLPFVGCFPAPNLRCIDPATGGVCAQDRPCPSGRRGVCGAPVMGAPCDAAEPRECGDSYVGCLPPAPPGRPGTGSTCVRFGEVGSPCELLTRIARLRVNTR
ncbi:hypothetical protein BU14_0749s0002 [Porphyra umbilicalis]|uniref:Uncharacterized protein n=1 Tax=Porphyra umbilicalis TaxID=2786 RepID=A0A1X6NPD1_PORUM|nr:hypothetical protein BU14_0749s0002 [Porphyra umbilicalis]|eukprot:OSX70447.1 hypothetical protein BU14_0749s0002 [Porphyra umbilicalis]